MPRATRLALKIAGVKHWLWQAVDQTGIVLAIALANKRPRP